MRTRGLLLMFFILGCSVPVAMAADASVAISSPKDGNILSSMKKIKVKYKATLGEKGTHLHLYVDDQPEVMLHKLKGSYTVEPLVAGKHGICIKLMDKDHAETGTQDCVMFRVE